MGGIQIIPKSIIFDELDFNIVRSGSIIPGNPLAHPWIADFLGAFYSYRRAGAYEVRSDERKISLANFCCCQSGKLPPADISCLSSFQVKIHQTHIVLGFAHGISDATAGYLIGIISFAYHDATIGWLVLLYNLLAFPLQPLVGFLIDRVKSYKECVFIGILLSTLSIPFIRINPWVAISSIGIGSCLLHAGGGGMAIRIAPGKSGGLGIFLAPGVIGLALGITAGQAGAHLGELLIMALAFISIPIIRLNADEKLPPPQKHSFSPEGQEWVALVIMGILLVRSLTWTSIQIGLEGQTLILVAIGCAAAFGKLGGGFIYDYVGGSNWIITTYGFSGLLFAFGLMQMKPLFEPAILTGIFLLQLATPILLCWLGERYPNHPATAAGIGLGLIVGLAALPGVFGLNSNLLYPTFILFSTIIAISALLIVQRNKLVRRITEA
jgi:FSR family fosmidomycin resistance protein-like MFS transporter